MFYLYDNPIGLRENCLDEISVSNYLYTLNKCELRSYFNIIEATYFLSCDC